MILVYRVESNRASNRTGPLFDSIYRTGIPCSTRSNRVEPSRTELCSVRLAISGFDGRDRAFVSLVISGLNFSLESDLISSVIGVSWLFQQTRGGPEIIANMVRFELTISEYLTFWALCHQTRSTSRPHKQHEQRY